MNSPKRRFDEVGKIEVLVKYRGRLREIRCWGTVNVRCGFLIVDRAGTCHASHSELSHMFKHVLHDVANRSVPNSFAVSGEHRTSGACLASQSDFLMYGNQLLLDYAVAVHRDTFDSQQNSTCMIMPKRYTDPHQNGNNRAQP